MRFFHPDWPGRGLRLAYCMNLYPAENLDGVLEGLRTITLPLAERFHDARASEGFGVGLWIPSAVALDLALEERQPEFDSFARFFVDHRLDAFTFNAFPAGGFHAPGLKAGVFRPTWKAPERVAFTLAVASLATRLRARCAGAFGTGGGHLSVSTHCGMHASALAGEQDLEACADNLCLVALHLAQMEEEHGIRTILSLEPEPRSSANDTSELRALFERTRRRAAEVLARGFADLRGVSDQILERHLGACLDACHAAVEFEDLDQALENATALRSPLGKLQFSSALALRDPGSDEASRELLFSLDEPVYLHQVTGRGETELLRAGDLNELLRLWNESPGPWRDASEWRCHFHVPVDLGGVGAGLRTTRNEADRTLLATLDQPDRWGSEELHVEIETYTWDVLPTPARGPGDLVDGLEREYRHVLDLLAGAGWRRL